MITVHAELVGEQAILSQADLERLLELARRVEVIELQTHTEDLPTAGLVWLAQHGGAFDWLAEEPDLYTANGDS